MLSIWQGNSDSAVKALSPFFCWLCGVNTASESVQESDILTTILPTAFCFWRASKAGIMSSKEYSAAMTGLILFAPMKAASSAARLREKAVWPRTWKGCKYSGYADCEKLHTNFSAEQDTWCKLSGDGLIRC
jgi:hypothetical protein